MLFLLKTTPQLGLIKNLEFAITDYGQSIGFPKVKLHPWSSNLLKRLSAEAFLAKLPILLKLINLLKQNLKIKRKNF